MCAILCVSVCMLTRTLMWMYGYGAGAYRFGEAQGTAPRPQGTVQGDILVPSLLTAGGQPVYQASMPWKFRVHKHRRRWCTAVRGDTCKVTRVVMSADTCPDMRREAQTEGERFA